MRKFVVTVLCAQALLIPVANGLAAASSLTSAATPKSRSKTVTRKLVGQNATAGQWGSVQVNITLRTTTTTAKKPSSKYTDLGGQYSYHTSRSQYIMSQALPLLRQEFLSAQSANIRMISGATFTSQAFEQSLQSALLKAK